MKAPSRDPSKADASLYDARGRVQSSADARPELRALAQVVEEVRHVPEPKLDWDTLEARVMREAARETGARGAARAESGSALSWLWIPAFATALGASLLLWKSTTPSASDAGARAEQRQTTSAQPPLHRDPDQVRLASNRLDGDSLQPGHELQSLREALVVEHGGRATWTLLPGSRARLVERAGRIVVELAHGGLSASVVPSREPERFIVDAAGARVAVHGTVFHVRLDAAGSSVDVDEGVVSVTPKDGSGPAVLLRAPAHGEYTLKGTARAQNTHSVNTPRAVARRTAELPTATASVQSAAPLPEELTISQVEAGVQPFVAAVTQCFRQNIEVSPSLRVSARTSATLSVAPEGQVTQVVFSPPLSPAVQTCSEQASQSIVFAPSLHGGKVTRVLELSR